MRRLALAAVLILSAYGCTSTNNKDAKEPAANNGPSWLEKAEKSTSDAYKKEEAHFKQHGGDVMKFCRDDAHKLCAAVEKDPKLIDCLKKNESKLAPGCKNAVAEYAKTHK